MSLKSLRLQVLTPGDANAKTAKSNKKGGGYYTAILHLAPARCGRTGKDLCPHASRGCRKACLYTAGNGLRPSVMKSRRRKTREFVHHNEVFMAALQADIDKTVATAEAEGLKTAIRPNGTSDIRWEAEHPELFTWYPDVQWYDYTKDPERCAPGYPLPPNYHLTFSRSEDNNAACLRILAEGRHNVAVVFADGCIPETWNGYPVVSGDEDDQRFNDPPGGHVIALTAKGKGRPDKTGFVVRA